MFDWLKKVLGVSTKVEEEPVVNDPNTTNPVIIKPAKKKAAVKKKAPAKKKATTKKKAK